MRLRPSGNQGPVATSLTSFRGYQLNDAWVWEHLAQTRGRVVAGPADLAADVIRVQADVMAAPRDRESVLREVAIMRDRIASAKGPGDPWDGKLGQGRMQDIELVAQAAALLSGQTLGTIPDALQGGVACGWLSAETADHLGATYRLCWSLQIGSRLISDTALSPENDSSAASDFLCRITGSDSIDALRTRLDEDTRIAAEMIAAALPVVTEEG